MAKRVKSDFVLTPHRKEFYKNLSLWLKQNNIPFRKLQIGLEVNVSNIPKYLMSEWIEKSTYKDNN